MLQQQGDLRARRDRAARRSSGLIEGSGDRIPCAHCTPPRPGMMAQELNVQVISNNIANMRTTGYKRQRAEFQDLLYQHVRRVGTQTSDQGNILPAGIELGSGVKTVGTPRVMTQGNAAADRQGIRRRDPRRGLLPDPAAGRPHRLYPRRLVRARRAGPHRHRAGLRRAARHHGAAELDRHHHQPAGPGLGRCCRARPRRRSSGRSSCRSSSTRPACRRIGDNLYLETPASGTPQNGQPNVDGFGNLQQGNLEQANVEAVTEISDLIAAQRAYEMNAKVITAADQMLSATSNLMR